jgi:hypothetical protein
MRDRCLVAMLILAVAATLELRLNEFLDLQRSTDEELRRRFKLPASCDPAMSAVGRGAKVVVTIRCTDDSAETIDYSYDAAQ